MSHANFTQRGAAEAYGRARKLKEKLESGQDIYTADVNWLCLLTDRAVGNRCAISMCKEIMATHVLAAVADRLMQ